MFSQFFLLGEHVLKFLWPEAAFIVVAHAVAAVLTYVDAGKIDSKERIG